MESRYRPIIANVYLAMGRVYGGGLHKLEPKELANVDASAIAALLPGYERGVELTQPDMFGLGELAA